LAGMQAILAITVPFFALVLLGWLAARAGPLPESAIPGLNAYVLFFALPCMLFRFGASLPLARLADPVLLGIYLVAALAMVAIGGRPRARGRARRTDRAARRADQSPAVGDRPRRRVGRARARAARAGEPDRAHARRFGDAGGALHDRRGALSGRQPCAFAHP